MMFNNPDKKILEDFFTAHGYDENGKRPPEITAEILLESAELFKTIKKPTVTDLLRGDDIPEFMGLPCTIDNRIPYGTLIIFNNNREVARIVNELDGPGCYLLEAEND